MEIKASEKLLIDEVRAIGCFAMVESMGRKRRPAVLNFPAAFAVYLSDKPIQTMPRTILKRRFSILVVNENLEGEEQAAEDTYGLIEKVRDRLNGNTFDQANIGPMEFLGDSFEDYEDGVISYSLFFQTTIFLPVVRRT